MVSIVVVCHNQWPFTLRCLRSVLACTASPYEVIVVDNGSTDATTARLRSLGRRVRRVRNATNLGFAAAVNQGARLARGRKLLLLNNDVIVAEGYLQALRRALEAHPEAAAVAPFTSPKSAPSPGRPAYPPHYRDAAGFRRFSWAFMRAHRLSPAEPSSPAAFACFCHLIRKRAFDALGGFDERFSPAYYEDVDFFLRAVRAGWTLLRTPAAFVHHFWGATADGNGWDKAALARSARARFVAKWGPGGWREAHRMS